MKLRVKLGLFLGALHRMLVAYIGYLIIFGTEPDWPMYWLIFFGIDFPVSLLFMGLGFLVSCLGAPATVPFLPERTNDVLNFLLPIFVFGMLGTLWYAWLPTLVIAIGERVAARGKREAK